jgi:hypothetical protein
MLARSDGGARGSFQLCCCCWSFFQTPVEGETLVRLATSVKKQKSKKKEAFSAGVATEGFDGVGSWRQGNLGFPCG